MKKYTVVTRIFNGYEKMREIVNPQKDAEYLLLTDNPNLTSETWNVKYVPEFDNPLWGGREKNYFVKYTQLDWIDTEYLISLDSSTQILDGAKLSEFMGDFIAKGYDAYFMYHPFNSNILAEYDAFEKNRNNSPYFKRKFIERVKYSFDTNNGFLLASTSFVMKKNSSTLSLLKDMVECLFLDEKHYISDLNDQSYLSFLVYTKYRFLKLNFLSGTFLTNNMLQVFEHNSDIPCTWWIRENMTNPYYGIWQKNKIDLISF